MKIVGVISTPQCPCTDLVLFLGPWEPTAQEGRSREEKLVVADRRWRVERRKEGLGGGGEEEEREEREAIKRMGRKLQLSDWEA